MEFFYIVLEFVRNVIEKGFTFHLMIWPYFLWPFFILPLCCGGAGTWKLIGMAELFEGSFLCLLLILEKFGLPGSIMEYVWIALFFISCFLILAILVWIVRAKGAAPSVLDRFKDNPSFMK